MLTAVLVRRLRHARSPADSATGCSWTNLQSLVSRRIHRRLRVPPTGSSAATFTKNTTSCRHDGRMPVLSQFLGDLRSLVLTRASGPSARFTTSPGRKSGDTGSLGSSRNCMARSVVFAPGVPQLPPGAFMESESSVRGCPCPESRRCSGTDPSQRIGRRRQDAGAQSASSERRAAGTDPPRRIGRRSERPATGRGQPRTVAPTAACRVRRRVRRTVRERSPPAQASRDRRRHRGAGRAATWSSRP